MENERLKIENKNLIQDRNFLIEQIKFLQSIISSNMNLQNVPNNLKHSSEILSQNLVNNSFTESKDKDIESHTFNKPKYGFEAGKAKISRFFSLTFVCMLGLICLMINSDYEESIGMNAGGSYKPKGENTDTILYNYSYSITTRIFSIVLFILSLTAIFYYYGKDYIDRRKKIK
jgi:hypothetical protein